MVTYMILKGDNSNNADVLGYFHLLRDAREVLIDNYSNENDVFILMMRGYSFGEGFHKYTMKLVNGKFKRENI